MNREDEIPFLKRNDKDQLTLDGKVVKVEEVEGEKRIMHPSSANPQVFVESNVQAAHSHREYDFDAVYIIGTLKRPQRTQETFYQLYKFIPK